MAAVAGGLAGAVGLRPGPGEVGALFGVACWSLRRGSPLALPAVLGLWAMAAALAVPEPAPHGDVVPGATLRQTVIADLELDAVGRREPDALTIRGKLRAITYRPRHPSRSRPPERLGGGPAPSANSGALAPGVDGPPPLPEGAPIIVRMRPEEACAVPGATIRVFGQLVRRGPDRLARLRVAPGACRIEMAAPTVLSRIDRARGQVVAKLRAYLPPGNGAAIVLALVTGDRSALTPPLQRSMRASGLSHLLAVSGLHLGLVMGAAFFLTGWGLGRSTWLARRTDVRIAAAWLVSPLIWGFALFVGGGPSILRAGFVMQLVFLGVVANRRADPLNALGVVVGGVLLAAPETARTVGFQLSVVGALALLLSSSALRRCAGRRRRWRAGVLLQLALNIALAPLLVFHFQSVSLVAPVLNLAMVPWTSLAVLPVSLVTGALMLVAPQAGALVAPLAAASASVVADVATAVAARPGVEWSGVSLTLAGAVLLTGGVLLALARHTLRGLGLGCILLGIGVETLAAFSASRDQAVMVRVLDVGQGDAILVEPPGAAAPILVDTGPPAWRAGREAPVVAALRRHRVSRLAAIVLTHSHADHAGALCAVLAAVRVDEVLWNGDGMDELPCANPRTWKILRAGTHVGGRSGLRVDVLWPPAPGAEALPENDRSIVLRVTAGGRRVLLLGDLERRGELGLLRRWGPAALRSDAVKIGHHGSNTSSSEDLLAAVRPTVAVISAAAGNKFGFPQRRALERIRRRASQVLQTGASGDVSLRLDPAEVTVHTRRSASVVDRLLRPGG